MKKLNLRLRSLMPGNRPPMHRRSLSSSSEASHQSQGSPNSRGSEDQFVFSPATTPTKEKSSNRVMVSRAATEPSAPRESFVLAREVDTHPRDKESIPSAPSYLKISPSCKSRPIAIQSHQSPASAPQPTEPLSARGDIAGAYFPLHEDPQSRVRAPHPFSTGADMSRQDSLRRAAESSRSGTTARESHPSRTANNGAISRSLGVPNPSALGTQPRSPGSSNKAESFELPLTSTTASPLTSPHTPVSSYLPSGVHEDVVLPMGKYYPSNWEKRQGKAAHTQHRPPTLAQPLASGIRSEPQVPKYHGGGDHAHSKPGSDVKRRLQQYQRDMVAQAAMAANALLANSPTAADSIVASSTTGVSVPTAKLAATFLKTHKPHAPRLRPVGSPGPVTPMSLEGDSYLSVGRPVSPSSSASDGGELGTSMPAGKGKQKQPQRDSGCSPLDLSAASV
ncbi:hypothetical protein VTI74DRAFT_10064 [Chaetomium olivicolor]